jgi:hypothetical protein
MVNAVVDLKCQYERDEIVAHFKSQTVLKGINAKRILPNQYLSEAYRHKWITFD